MGLGGGIMNYKDEARAKIGTENFPLTLNVVHQNKHIEGSSNFDPTRSTLTADADELIRLYAGNGVLIPGNAGSWSQKEWFVHSTEVGIFRNINTGVVSTTNKGMLHYSKRGVHVVPSDPKGVWK
jgi:hypothetical protein